MSTESAATETPRVTIGGGNPDPLTVAQLLREVGALEKQTTLRMDAIEKAVAVAHDDLVRAPTDLRVEITALRELLQTKLEVHGEKFTGVDRQFRDNKTAIDDALKAQKELADEQNKSSAAAILKAEDRTSKQMDQLMALIKEVQNGLQSSVTEVKERIGRIENVDSGRTIQRIETRETTTDKRDDSKFYIAVIALIASIAGIAIGYLSNR